MLRLINIQVSLLVNLQIYQVYIIKNQWPHNIGNRPVVLWCELNAKKRNYLFLCNGKSTRAHHLSRLIGAAHCGKLSTHASTITNKNELYHARNKVHCSVTIGIRKRVTENNSGIEMQSHVVLKLLKESQSRNWFSNCFVGGHFWESMILIK